VKNIIQQITPPILLSSIKSLKRSLGNSSFSSNTHTITNQDLDIYWNPKMAELLETWGEGSVWSEIQFLMANCEGKVLDIACGTGKTMEIVSNFSNIEAYGIDISDLLISKAIARGISSSHLKVGDAVNTGYSDSFYNYSYSIGSLEHFTNEGILQFVAEAYRVTKTGSFHMLPVSRSGKDEGWMKTVQSFHNNSVDWWLEKFSTSYQNIHVVDSSWNDDISVGKWFLCYKDESKAID
jgi:ubiquinone/menaquinone biosynthesis C-methylase UbiE